mmetsp:Transcript_33704/g.37675  ORF Transcript_33704/g.37675 Transcript_33704/m.37675 type:complete len:191 (-) Transcript_33704:468-1040(-)
MTFQQMKSSDDTTKIKAIAVHSSIDLLRDVERPNLHHHRFLPTSSLIDTPSIAVDNYNIHINNISYKQSPIEPYRIQLSTTDNESPSSSIQNPYHRLSVEPYRIQLLSLNWMCSSFGNFSQPTACIATRFGECSCSLLDRLWYLYSYIYRRVSSNTTTIIVPLLLLFFVAVILMPTTDTPPTSTTVPNIR